jgi:hypothetical protein
MALSDLDFVSIRSLVERVVSEISGRRDSFFVTGKVIKRDEAKKLVWLKEFGDQPIPVVGFDYIVKYYDEGADGVTRVKKSIVQVQVPMIGATVFVARELGSRRLPRCLGVIQGKDWLVAEVE